MKIVFILKNILIYLCLVEASFALLSNENDRIESGLSSDNQNYMLRNHSQILSFYYVIVVMPLGKLLAFVFNTIEYMTSNQEINTNLYTYTSQTIQLFSNDNDKADFKHIYSFQKQIKRVK